MKMQNDTIFLKKSWLRNWRQQTFSTMSRTKFYMVPATRTILCCTKQSVDSQTKLIYSDLGILKNTNMD